jgi:pSer/pThr/pTyr-binding forkhead associated (FHA) protein
MELKLVVLEGAKEGLEIPLKKDKFLIGRASECTLRAGSEAISRRHCAILRVKDCWAVRDLGSRNGTYVNDKKIAKPVRLNPGDELRVGPLKFRVAAGARKSAEAAPSSSVTTAPAAKPHKQPPVKDVSDMAERTRKKASGSTTEDDITRWLLGNDTGEDATLKETRTIRLEETATHKRVSPPQETTEGVNPGMAEAEGEQPAQNGDDSKIAEDDSKSSWGLFKRKGSKTKPGKLPPRPDQGTKDSREAAAEILREMTRRR